MMDMKELEYIEQEIKSWKRALSKEHFDLMHDQSEYDLEFGDGAGKDHLVEGLRFLYYHILAYLEAKGMPQFLANFQKRYSSLIEKDSPLHSEETMDFEGYPVLKVLVEFDYILAPFKAFDSAFAKKEEINHLQEVLKGTRYILQNVKAKLSSETSIYKEVEWVLKLFYPKARKAKQSDFRGYFKEYKPDVLIPELKTAVEYKYIRKDKNIDDYIDQVKVDAINYKGDYRFENFIAVLCLEDAGHAPEANIRKSWSDKGFPNNWDLVIVFL